MNWYTGSCVSGFCERCLTEDSFDLQVEENGHWSVYNLRDLKRSYAHGVEPNVKAAQEIAIKVYEIFRSGQ
jgi:hypothetical protein